MFLFFVVKLASHGHTYISATPVSSTAKGEIMSALHIAQLHCLLCVCSAWFSRHCCWGKTICTWLMPEGESDVAYVTLSHLLQEFNTCGAGFQSCDLKEINLQSPLWLWGILEVQTDRAGKMVGTFPILVRGSIVWQTTVLVSSGLSLYKMIMMKRLWTP